MQARIVKLCTVQTHNALPRPGLCCLSPLLRSGEWAGSLPRARRSAPRERVPAAPEAPLQRPDQGEHAEEAAQDDPDDAAHGLVGPADGQALLARREVRHREPQGRGDRGDAGLHRAGREDAADVADDIADAARQHRGHAQGGAQRGVDEVPGQQHERVVHEAEGHEGRAVEHGPEGEVLAVRGRRGLAGAGGGALPLERLLQLLEWAVQGGVCCQLLQVHRAHGLQDSQPLSLVPWGLRGERRRCARKHGAAGGRDGPPHPGLGAESPARAHAARELRKHCCAARLGRQRPARRRLDSRTGRRA
mmetsp:Transcript_105791/g.341287  ORF Transcript_105791/g.341287 Transcript_105791/m.341287 type:complete len:305 (+) Transcript_105791:2-916(+)